MSGTTNLSLIVKDNYSTSTNSFGVIDVTNVGAFAAEQAGDTLTLTSGNNIVLDFDENNKEIVISTIENLIGATGPTGATGLTGATGPQGPGGTVTSVAVTGSNISVSGSPITSNGTISVSIPQAVNTTSSVQFGSFGVGTPASGTSGEIRATNNITSYYSDDRLKTRLGNIENALEKVCLISGFYYTANETAQELGYKPVKEVGVSAQEVQKVLPEVVVPAPIDDQYLTVRYEKIIPLLIEAIKELEKEIADLKKQNK